MSKEQKVTLILHKGDMQDQSPSDSTREPHVRIIALVRLLARHAAEQDFDAGVSSSTEAPDRGREK